VDYQLVDWNDRRVRKTSQEDKAPPEMDGEHVPLEPGVYVDVMIQKTPFKRLEKPLLKWWPATIESVDSSGIYTVKCSTQEEIAKREAPWHEKGSQEDVFRKAEEEGRKAAQKYLKDRVDDTIVSGLTRKEIRIVCNCDDCRRHNFVLTLPQLWCQRCQWPLRQPAQQWYMHTDDDVKTPLHFCDKCYKALSKSEEEVRKTAVKLKLTNGEAINLSYYKQVHMPKEPSYRPGEPSPVTEGTPGENIGASAAYVQCSSCKKWYHWPCALYNAKEFYQPRWQCQECAGPRRKVIKPEYRARALMGTLLGEHIEKDVTRKFLSMNVEHPPILVRVISALRCKSLVPESLRRRWQDGQDTYPSEFEYMSKSIMVFQEQGNIIVIFMSIAITLSNDQGDCDVCLFSMYVHEYGLDCAEPNRGR